MKQSTLGDQELALLRFVSEHGPITAGETSLKFGEPNGLARSTIETVLTRLNKKGYLKRVHTEGVFRYQPTMAPQEVIGGIVDQFVEKTLGGSLTPLVSYFVRQGHLSETELDELQQLIAKLESGRQESEK